MSDKGKCPVCGKAVIIRNVHDLRNNTPSFCSRVCATNLIYSGSRYGESPEWERKTARELMERKP